MKKIETLKLWTLHISHRHGDDMSVHLTQEDAKQSLCDFVVQDWDQSMTERYGDLATMTDDQILAAWSNFQDECGSSDFATIEPHDLDVKSLGLCVA